MPLGGRLRKRHAGRRGNRVERVLCGEFRQRVLVARVTPGVLSRGVDAASSQLLLAARFVRTASGNRFPARSAGGLPSGISFALISEVRNVKCFVQRAAFDADMNGETETAFRLHATLRRKTQI